MRKMKKTLATAALVSMALTALPAQLFAADAPTTRLADVDRVGTSIAIANNGWTSADTVIVAPADDANLVDALAVAPLAGQANAPILMTYKDGLDARVQAEITKLGAKNVYAVGALSKTAVDQLGAISGVTVTPLQGQDRFETAAKIAAKLTSPKGTFVVGYNGVADAMSAASYAAANGYAIEIADLNGSLPSNEATVGSTVYTLGGPSLVADIAGATRIAGNSRYDTNDQVLQKLTFKYDTVYVANGETLVDALAGSSLAAKTQSPIILTDGVNATAAATARKSMTYSSQTIAFGGTGAVPESVRTGVYTQPTAGAAAGVTVSTPTDLIANGHQTETLTVKVVDAAGVPVTNFVGFLKVGYKSGYYNGATYLTDPASGTADTSTSSSTTKTYSVTSGVANVKIAATSTAYVTDTLSFTATYTKADGTVVSFPVQYADVNSVAQAAASIQLTGPTSLSNNTANTYAVQAKILDADGQAMTSGTFSVKFKLTGAAIWNDDTTSDKTIGTSIVSSAAVANANVKTQVGVAGTATLTASVAGLPDATYSAPVVTAQAAKALTLTTASQDGVVGGDRIKYTVNLVDANGYLATTSSSVTINIKTANNTDDLDYYNAATAGSSLGSVQSGSVSLSAGQSSVSFWATSSTAGTVNFTVSDAAGNYTSASGSGTFTAGSYGGIKISPLNKLTDNTTKIGMTIPASAPTQTITIQAKDAGGNAVPASLYVALAAVGGSSNTGTAKINDLTATTTSPVVLATDNSGKITATLSVGGYLNDTWTVEAAVVATPTTVPSSSEWTAGVSTGRFTVGYTTASQLSVAMASNQLVSGGSGVLATVTVKDANGVNVTGDALRVTTNDDKMTLTGSGVTKNTVQSDANTNVYDITAGTYTFSVVGGEVGTQSFVVKDMTSPNFPTITKSLVVTSGTANKLMVLTPNGDQKAYSIASGTKISGPFTVQLADANGNAVVATSDITISQSTLDTILANGTGDVAAFAGIRTTSDGANVATLKIVAGTSSTTFYAEVTTTGQMVPGSTTSWSY